MSRKNSPNPYDHPEPQKENHIPAIYKRKAILQYMIMLCVMDAHENSNTEPSTTVANLRARTRQDLYRLSWAGIIEKSSSFLNQLSNTNNFFDDLDNIL